MVTPAHSLHGHCIALHDESMQKKWHNVRNHVALLPVTAAKRTRVFHNIIAVFFQQEYNQLNMQNAAPLAAILNTTQTSSSKVSRCGAAEHEHGASGIDKHYQV